MFIPILAYHKVDKQFEWGINTVLPQQFERQIKFLAENGYSTIHLTDYLTQLVKPEKKVIITFDDSYKSIIEFAYPVLKKYGFNATIFVISEYVGKKNTWDINLGRKVSWHLNWSELRQLVLNSWEIGSHTANHLDLTGLTYSQLMAELTLSKKKLEQRLEIPVNLISYPFNRFNLTTIKAAEEAGYIGGCCTALNNHIPVNLRHFTIPRMGIYLIDNFAWYRLKVRSPFIAQIDLLRQRIISFCATGTIYYKRLKKLKKRLAI